MVSRWCRNVFNDWHFIWLHKDLPQNRMIIVVLIGIGMMNLGYGSVMIVVQVIVGIISMVGDTIKINPLLKIHRRLNRINRLLNLKVELEAVQREDLKYVAIHKKEFYLKYPNFWSDLYECEYSLFHVFL